MTEPTDEMREAFARAMEADDGTAAEGERALLAGLAAVLALVERQHAAEIAALRREVNIAINARIRATKALRDGYEAWQHDGQGNCPHGYLTRPHEADEHHYDVPCGDRPYCRIPEHHEAGVLPP